MNDRERELWNSFQAGDEDALEELLAMHMSLVTYWANWICRIVPSANREHLILEGRDALVQAAERFDLKKGNEFRSYAQYGVQGAMLKSPEVKLNITSYQLNRYHQIVKAQDQLVQQTGEKPSIEQIAEATNLRAEQVLDAIDAWAIAVAEPSSDLQPEMFASHQTEADQQAALLLQEALFSLEAREYKIIRYYYWDNLSTEKIASKLGMSVPNVKKVRAEAQAKIYRHLNVKPKGKKG